MLKTRNKRNINLGAQALITKVEENDGMLNVSPEIRGHMINLKKILFYYIEEKVKLLTVQILKKGQYLCFSGTDALNMHFANKQMHTGFVELVITPKAENDKSIEMVAEELMKVMNDRLIEFSSKQDFLLTKEVLEGCRSTNSKNGRFFEINRKVKDRLRIGFYVYSDTNKIETQNFLEIKYIDNMKIKPFEKYGIFFIPLAIVEKFIKQETLISGHEDWKAKQITFEQAMKRGGLTFSQWTMLTLSKLCFPQILMRVYEDEDVVLQNIDNLMRFAPESSQKHDLEKQMKSEIANYKDMSKIEKIVTLENLLHRAMILGLIPSGPEIMSTLTTSYNITILREIREIC